MTNTSSQVIAVPSYDETELDDSMVRGIAWTGGMKWLGQLLNWGSTLLVARLLTPEDYGLMGMAYVYIGLVALFSEFGLGAAVITQRELTDNQVAQLNTLSVLIGLAALVISCGAAIPLANFFSTPPLRWVVVTMSLAFVISAFQTVPSALLQRDLQFKWLGLIEVCQALVLAVTMIILAYLGFGYWTLVLGNVWAAILLTAVVLMKRRHGFAWPRAQELRGALTFGSHILVGRLTWYLQSNADFLVAGRVLGQSALGVYSIGWTLASVPVDKVSSILARVTPAFFSTVQADFAALRRYLLGLTEALALITIPLGWGLALVADEFVLLLLGDKWRAVAGPLQILAVLASFRTIVTLLPQILNATRDSRFTMYNGIMGIILLPVGFWIGSRWGIIGIAAAWIAVYPFLALPLYCRVFKRIGLSTTEYFRALWPALSGSLLMAVVVWVIKQTLLPTWPLPLRLVLQVLGGGTAYIFSILALHRARLHAFYQFYAKSMLTKA